MPKPKFDKSKYSKAGKEQHPVKVVSTKRPITKPPAKDKAVLNSVRWASAGLGRQAGPGARERLPAGSCEARHPGWARCAAGVPAGVPVLGSFQSLARQLKS